MMTVDWNAFTPWTALAGGAIIGLAAAMFALLNGRIAGISGVIGGLLKPARGDVAWRAAFVLGWSARRWSMCCSPHCPSRRSMRNTVH
jgi:uncharacterized protein